MRHSKCARGIVKVIENRGDKINYTKGENSTNFESKSRFGKILGRCKIEFRKVLINPTIYIVSIQMIGAG